MIAKAAPVNDRSAAIDGIAEMDLPALRAEWTKRFGTPPALRSVELMRLMLAWRVQARLYGGLDKPTRQKLKSKRTVDTTAADLVVGTVLIRDWQGQRVEVTIEEGGFRWGDQTYPSLSAVASAVTGTRWNGPRFFGLRGGRA